MYELIRIHLKGALLLATKFNAPPERRVSVVNVLGLIDEFVLKLPVKTDWTIDRRYIRVLKIDALVLFNAVKYRLSA